MYPTIYHALLDLTGIDLPFLRFMNSFGFFVALAFVVASWTLSLELRRRERSGLLKTSVRRITVGAAATPLELLTNAAIGFVLGFKALYLLLNFERATADPQAFLLSGMGSLIGGLLGAGLLAYLKWHEKNKAKLATPKVEEVRMQPSDHANNITLTAALWGIIGAKLFHWLENPDEFVHFIQDPSGDKIFSGLTMYGGLILAGAMVMRYFKLHGIPVWQGADSAAPGVMIAYGIGRIGCHVSGDGDWGIVNTTFLGPGPKWFWQYDYPNNVNSVGVALIDGRPCFDGYCTVLPETVWPTPLYETIVSVALFFLLWSLRERLRPAGMIFFLYLFLNGLERFFIEKIRVNVEVFGHITQAEIISTVLMIVGIGGMLWLRKTKTLSHEPGTTH
jgi:phosphatidylglycerol:prolipoprotein diacylglycerol transferase